MRIAVDAMGGDHAPAEVVAGAIQAAGQIEGEILLVGDPNAIAHAVPGTLPTNVRIVEASQRIEMHESPVDALRKKKDSSLLVAANMVREGEADAMISAGNTGAAAAAAHMYWKCLPGISRPAIATVMPSQKGRFVLLDSGATPDCNPRNLLEFAIMGSAYAQAVLAIPNPKIGLLNIGEEETKGNSLAKQSYKLLQAEMPGFCGNVEGKDVFRGHCDVVVCDGFVGNVVLKTAEGVGEFFFEVFKEAVSKRFVAKIVAGLFLKQVFREMIKRADYAEYGGAPLLGVNGLCVICHGRSNAKAISNAILVIKREYQEHLNDLITRLVANVIREDANAV